MITYTEICVVIKFLCQFGFFPWNNTAYIIKMSNSIDYVPGVLGIRKEEYYAFWDIALLVGEHEGFVQLLIRIFYKV